MVLFGLAGREVRAQVRGSVPGATEPHRAVVPPAPGPGTLSASKVEEALRMLLKATARDSVQTGTPRLPEIEIGNLVLDQTLTKIGHDFYALFYGQWDPPPGLSEFTVIIREKPGRGTSTLVSIEINDNALVELPLSPNYEALEEAAAYSLTLATDYLATARSVGQQLEQAPDNPGTEVY
jgi:curli production assembly/transport component CsgE